MNEINYFNPDHQYFIIDSNNLNGINSKLYGYFFLKDGLVVNYEDIKNRKPDGVGSYILIEKKDNKITITQDCKGSRGLFLYKLDNYWAISNNFNYLVDFLKNNHSLTFNKEYADAFLLMSMCSHVYEETMINEISMLDRYAVVEIDINNKLLSINIKRKPEKTISIDTKKGLDHLDEWYNKWVSIIAQLIKYHNGPIITDLSGGMDSRMVLTLFLNPIIDLSYVKINSINDNKRNHKEDFSIASLIAETNGFLLNQPNRKSYQERYYSLQDIISHISFQTLTFHKQFKSGISAKKPFLIHFSGHGGGDNRNIFSKQDDNNYVDKNITDIGTRIYYGNAKKCIEGAKNILNRSIEKIKKTYKDSNIHMDNAMQTLAEETRSRIHAGQFNRPMGKISAMPLYDSMIMDLTGISQKCNDPNLLPAIIYSRYYCNLLDFPIEGNRSIDSQTKEYARQLNKKYPYKGIKNIDLKPLDNGFDCDLLDCDKQLWDIPTNQKKHTRDEIDIFFNRVFLSSTVNTLFSSVYGRQLYEEIKKGARNKSWHPYSDWHVVIAIAKAIYDTNCIGKTKDILNTPEFIFSCAKEISPSIYNKLMKELEVNSYDVKTKVSVVIPVFNAAPFLNNLFNDLSNQTFDDFEVIFVDDGSTDESLDMIIKQCESDARFSYLHQDRSGAGVARNKGASVANGKYIIWLDADDRYSVDLLKELYSTADKHQADITMCLYDEIKTFIDMDYSGIGFYTNKFPNNICVNPQNVENLFISCGHRITNKLYDREFVIRNKIEYSNTMSSNDVFFNYATIAVAKKVVGIHKNLLKVSRFINNHSISSNRSNYTKDSIIECNRLYDWLKEKGLNSTYFQSYLKKTIYTISYNCEFSYNHDFINLVVETICNKEPWNLLNQEELQSYWKLTNTNKHLSEIKSLQNNNELESSVIQNRIRRLNNLIFNISNIEKIAYERYGVVLNPNSNNTELLNNKIKELEFELNKEKSSWHYRIAYFLTYIPKRIYSFLENK